MMGLSLYALPSLLAILVKIGLLIAYWPAIRQRPVLYGLFSAFMLLAGIEFGSFFVIDQAGEFVWLMQAYYITTVFTALLILLFVYELLEIDHPIGIIIHTVLACLVATATAVPGLVIADVQVIGVTAMRVQGPLYFVWQIFMVITLCMSVAVLAHGHRKAKERQRQRACLLILIGITPFVVAAVGVVAAMAVGLQLNAIAILSTAVIGFMATLAISHRQFDVFQWLRRMPGTQERSLMRRAKRAHRKLIKHVLTRHDDAGSYKAALKELETCAIELSIWTADDNRSLAARRLGISRATLLRKIAS